MVGFDDLVGFDEVVGFDDLVGFAAVVGIGKPVGTTQQVDLLLNCLQISQCPSSVHGLNWTVSPRCYLYLCCYLSFNAFP